LDYLYKDADNDMVWKYPCIASNQGLSVPDNPDYKVYKFMLMREWENGWVTAELKLKARDEPSSCGNLEIEDWYWKI
jgi:hypothetical protein